MSIYKNRRDAGIRLAAHLAGLETPPDPVVLALPRGGVPVACEVAAALKAPLALVMVRKLGAPGQEEVAMGAIASGGIRIVNEAVVRRLGLTDRDVAAAANQEQRALEALEQSLGGGRPRRELQGRNLVLVDDGMATGASMRAAVLALRPSEPARLLVAVPLASVEACAYLAPVVDRVVCLETPEPFRSVGRWYDDFAPVTDAEVLAGLRRVPRA